MSGIDKYAVFGNPIKHSKSPAIHAAFAAQCAQQMHYRAVLVELNGFTLAARNFFDEGGEKGIRPVEHSVEYQRSKDATFGIVIDPSK